MRKLWDAWKIGCYAIYRLLLYLSLLQITLFPVYMLGLVFWPLTILDDKGFHPLTAVFILLSLVYMPFGFMLASVATGDFMKYGIANK